MKAEAKAAKMTGEKLAPERAATLPDIAAFSDDKLPGMPMLSRTDTGGSLPPYATRPNTPGGIELSNMNRVGLARTETNGSSGSNASYAPTVPLVSAAADMGYGPVPSQAPGMMPPRPGTAMSQRSQASGMVPPQRPGTAVSQRSLTSRPGAGPQAGMGVGNQYGYGNSQPGSQQPMGPMGPTAPPTIHELASASVAPGESAARNLGQPTVPQLSSDPRSRRDLGPSNSQRSLGSGSVASAGTSAFDIPQGPQMQAMRAPPRQHHQPLNPDTRRQSPHENNPYERQPSPEQYGGARRPPIRSATAGPMPSAGPLYPVQRSATGPVPNRSATTDPYQQRQGPPQDGVFAPIQRSNTGEEFSNGRWVPPSQRNNANYNTANEFSGGRWVPPSQRNNARPYDLEAQYNERARYQY